VHTRVAIIYNEPYPSRYDAVGEEKAVLGVLEAVEAVHRALLEIGCHVTRVPLIPPFEQARGTLRALHTDLVFNLFEGFCGYPETEAMVPEVLSEIEIPYTGCSGSALRLALDKAQMKAILRAAQIRTPDFQLLNPETLPLLSQEFHLDFPCIVKPRCEDASHGLSPESVVDNYIALVRQIILVSNRYGGDALVEKFIDGREFNATVLGNFQCTVFPPSEIAYSLPPAMPPILTFVAKWEPDSPYFQGSKAICPANIKAEEQRHITEIVAAAFGLLGGKGYARVDMRMDRNDIVHVIEVNPNPDISPGSGAVLQAEAAGMTYTRFIGEIVELALEKKLP
jgi:D-alanine-D-alanine ligase